MSKKFPKTVYVWRDNYPGDESLLIADPEEPTVDESTPVAIYQLVEVATLEVTRTLKTRKSRVR